MFTCYQLTSSYLQSNNPFKKVFVSATSDYIEQSVPQICFGSYFEKGKIFPFGKESIFPFPKNHPLSEEPKFKLSLCMSLVFGASRNVSFSKNNHILQFFTEGFKIYSWFFFLVPKIYWVLSSAHGCIYTSHLGSLIQTFTTRWQTVVLPFNTKQILILVKTVLLNWYIYQVIWRLSIADHRIWIKFIFLFPFNYHCHFF